MGARNSLCFINTTNVCGLRVVDVGRPRRIESFQFLRSMREHSGPVSGSLQTGARLARRGEASGSRASEVHGLWAVGCEFQGGGSRNALDGDHLTSSLAECTGDGSSSCWTPHPLPQLGTPNASRSSSPPERKGSFSERESHCSGGHPKLLFTPLPCKSSAQGTEAGHPSAPARGAQGMPTLHCSGPHLFRGTAVPSMFFLRGKGVEVMCVLWKLKGFPDWQKEISPDVSHHLGHLLSCPEA